MATPQVERRLSVKRVKCGGAFAIRRPFVCALVFVVTLLLTVEDSVAVKVRLRSKESETIRIVKVEYFDVYRLSQDPESESDELIVAGQDLRFIIRCKTQGRGKLRMRYSGGQGMPSYFQTKIAECKQAGDIVEIRFHIDSWLSWTFADFRVLED